MQRSKKILLTVAGILLALFVSSLMVLRKDMQALQEQAESANRLTTVPVDEFQFLHFSGSWDVQVRQGRVYKVELAFANGNNYQPQLEHSNDTLYFTIQGDSTLRVQAKVVAPFVKSVQAIGGGNIRLKNFKLDSMSVVLDDSNLIGEENQIIYTSLKTTGNSRIEVVDDPFK